MDLDDADHLIQWIIRTVPEGERVTVLDAVMRVCLEHPDLVSSRGWPEIRRLAELAYGNQPATGRAR